MRSENSWFSFLFFQFPFIKMLSSDKNVENLTQLIEALKSYLSTEKEYLKFDVIDKVVRLITALTLAVVVLILVIAVLFYLSFAAVYWMEPALGTAGSFAMVALFFLVLLVLIVSFRKPWIERPLVRVMAGILLS